MPPHRGLRGLSQFEIRGNVQRFRGELVIKAHRLLHHSTLGLKVIKREGKGDLDVGERGDSVPLRQFAKGVVSQHPPEQVQGYLALKKTPTPLGP